MLKYALVATALTLAMSAPSFAAGGCEDDAAWNKTETDINGMAAGADKDEAMAEWEMAKKAKIAKSMNECDSHMSKAGTRAGGKKS